MLPAHGVVLDHNGGGERIRTDGLLLAKQALSRLSYTPNRIVVELVGLGRFELPTSRLSGVRSNRAELQALAWSYPGISGMLVEIWKRYEGGGPSRLKDVRFMARSQAMETYGSFERR